MAAGVVSLALGRKRRPAIIFKDIDNFSDLWPDDDEHGLTDRWTWDERKPEIDWREYLPGGRLR